jgi:CheY-like chemotaxis protein
MGANDLPQPGILSVQIMAIGFEATESGRLKTIFERATHEGRPYVLAPFANDAHFDLLLVNYDDPQALLDKQILLANAPGTPVVAVSRGALNDPPAYHLRGMLIAARVLSMLDKIPISSPSPPEPLPVSSPLIDAEPAPETLPAPDEYPKPPPTQAEGESGYRALVVDDSVAIQKSLELNLATLEQIQTIDFADSGEMALEKARARHYDLIFLDVMMPGIDGYEACSQLRKMPEYKKTPIIMVSGKNSPLDEVKGVIAGCTTYLTKPVQQEAFQKLSRRVLVWLENYRPTH